jgi:hypothetical protein
VLHFAAQIKIPGRLRNSLDLQAKASVDLKRVLAQRALFGIELLVNKKKVALSNFETKLRADPKKNSPVVLMLHGEIKIPAKSLQLVLTLQKHSEAIKLKILPGTRPPTKPTRGKVKKGQVVLQLKQKERVAWIHEAIK